jgi:hypothetical protein
VVLIEVRGNKSYGLNCGDAATKDVKNSRKLKKDLEKISLVQHVFSRLRFCDSLRLSRENCKHAEFGQSHNYRVRTAD